MNELKSISQIAAELGVTRQAIYNRIKSADLSTRLQQFTVNQSNKKVYSLQGQELIKQAFLSNAPVNCKPTIDSKLPSINSKLIDSLQTQIEIQTKIIETLTKQLEVKDNQINTLTETIKELTIALKAAQALHGMDKQQAVIEVQERPVNKAPTTTNANNRPRSERQQPRTAQHQQPKKEQFS
jgi:transcriptional antiterminator